MFANMDGLYKSPEIVIRLMCKAMALIFLTMLLSILPQCSHAIPVLCLLGVVWVNPK